MVKKFFLLFRTVRYLKVRQIVYQVYYRLKPLKTLTHYKKNRIRFFLLKFSIQYTTPNSYKEKNSFIFLNQLHLFPKEILWDFMDYGKLWNYNLQYFNFLHQKGLIKAVKDDLLCDINKWLETGQLRLEPYPVSLRVINTIRYLSLSGANNNGTIIADIYAQLNYLYSHLEYHLLGNHLLENAFALLMGGEAFEENKWTKKAKSILYKELDEQILNDGGHFELSLMYHQIILFRVLELIDWYSQSKEPDLKFLNFVKRKAVAMLNYLKSVGFKNGDISHFNDSAPGIGFTSQELFAFAQQLKLPEPKVIPLRESGYRKFGNENYECILDAGSIAPSYQPGHSHADSFSFVLHYHHVPFIVDVGISTYEKGDIRNYERSTKAHNTVEIENENQSEVWGGFRVGRRANVKIINETDSAITASHDGYKSLFNAIHKRGFYFEPNSVRLVDVIKNSKTVDGKSYLHFHPDCKVEEKHGRFMINNVAEISFINANRTDLESYKFALGYNLYQEAKVLVAEFHISIETLITFV